MRGSHFRSSVCAFCGVFVITAAHLFKGDPKICKVASFLVFTLLGNKQRNKENKANFYSELVGWHHLNLKRSKCGVYTV